MTPSRRFANNGQGGFNVMFRDGAVTGERQFQNNSTKFHAHTMTALSISTDRTKGWFAGTGTGDVFLLGIDGTPVNGSGQPLSGNIQIHK